MFARIVFALCLISSARGEKLHGINIGFDPNANVTNAEIQQYLARVAPKFNWVRTYTVARGQDAVGRIGHEMGLKVAMGAWLGKDDTVANRASNQRELDTLIATAKLGYVDMAVIGSETLLRGDLTPAALIDYIKAVKLAIPNVQVTTADSFAGWLDNPGLVTACDLIYWNGYPYWNGFPINRATSAFDLAYQQLLAVAGGKTITCSETGWPSAGYPKWSAAIATEENAASYFQGINSWSKARQAAVFWFAAQDEKWKVAEGEQGLHWGIWTDNWKLKPGRQAVFDGTPSPDSWTTSPSIGLRQPSHYGSEENVLGYVVGVKPKDYVVVVYILVGTSWWPKPTFDSRVPINVDGTWTCDITTGGTDNLATQVKAFLVPKTATELTISWVNSSPATFAAYPSLTINRAAALSVLTQPASQTIIRGPNASFSYIVDGQNTTTYQWQSRSVNQTWGNMPANASVIYPDIGVTAPTIVVPTKDLVSGSEFRCIATNPVGTVTSNTATLTLLDITIDALPDIQAAVQDFTRAVGTSITLTASVTGQPTPNLQWYRDSQIVTGATTANLTLTVQQGTQGCYSLVATNSVGSVTKVIGTITVLGAPNITVTQQDKQAFQGENVTFSATVTGASSIQWQCNGVTVVGGESSITVVASSTTQGTYTIIASNAAGTTTSRVGTLTIKEPLSRPSIVLTKQDYTAVLGQSITWRATISGNPTPTIQWQRNGQTLPSATGTTLTITAQAATVGTYVVIATNSQGSTQADAGIVSLPVGTPPNISIAAGDYSMVLGTTVNLRATISDANGMQWYLNGVAIQGATNSTLSFQAQPGKQGRYTVTATNASGTSTGDAGNVSVNYSALVNLSTRVYLQPDGITSVGFVLRGPANSTKSVVLRGIGPTLSQYGISRPLSDPQLALFNQFTHLNIGSNDNWGGTQVISQAFATVAAFPLSATSKDAALVTTLSPNPSGYTMQVSSSPGQAGTTILEVYDASSGDLTSQLVNLSSLGAVGAGEQVMILGFVIAGNQAKQLLIRAVGPGLAAHGVSNRLSDPQIAVYRGSTLLASNDNWGGQAQLQTAFALAGAFPLEVGSLDAAILAQLTPGAYTAIVTGGNSTGTALLEIYDLNQ